MPALELTGSYVGVESFRAATNNPDTTRDAAILEHLLAASREIERLTFRRFFPVTATNKYRWPPFHVAASWEIWTEDDLLSVSSIFVADSGQNASPVALTHYFLEPQPFGPPYNRVEIDLSSGDVFQAGPTPQQSVAITGQWGYANTTRAAGTLGAAITTTTATTITISDDTLIDQGDVILIDSEALYVDTPRRTPQQLTVQRGVNGTTATTHLNAAPISKYQAPASIRRVVRADAIGTFEQDLASWSRTIGAGEMAVEYQGKMAAQYRQQVVNEYRRFRTAAV